MPARNWKAQEMTTIKATWASTKYHRQIDIMHAIRPLPIVVPGTGALRQEKLHATTHSCRCASSDIPQQRHSGRSTDQSKHRRIIEAESKLRTEQAAPDPV